ncbi:H1FOO protein, partial [Todus mexicanus]|nr:H1FOO protein [Todus mexicanus]
LSPLPAARAAGTARLLSPLGQSQRSQHPPVLHMVMEALRAHDQKKGVSVITIKRFILSKYPAVDPIRLKYWLKQALSKGLSSGVLVRPPKSSAVGATGSFKVSRGCQSWGGGTGAKASPGPASTPFSPPASSREAAPEEAPGPGRS